MKAIRIYINGIVQGVGFRPFIYRLARERRLSGYVSNTSQGVVIVAQGQAQELESFVTAIRTNPPPQSLIEQLRMEEIEAGDYSGFHIAESQPGQGTTLISPDIALCADCRSEMLNPADRRYGYPFINCTNCGPRFSIIRQTPYDRPATTMADFIMCPQCRAEYHDPGNRRFHAQPIACPACGPRVWLGRRNGEPISEGREAILQAAQMLRDGGILALKGIGGFHLACDAANQVSVARLRQRKRRPHKPLALMVDSVDTAGKLCRLSPSEIAILDSPQAPIVLGLKGETDLISELVAPGNRYLGLMLPYSPLHRLLFEALMDRRPRPWALVMTSGNVSDLPIIIDNQQALEKLGQIADCFLLHDRPIANRGDDSIVFWSGRQPGHFQIVRHARGYAPNPLALPREVPPCLAVGGQMKNTFCLAQGGRAFLSQHIGEADNLETMDFFAEMAAKYRGWFGIEPRAIIHDLHPDYLTTRWARAQPEVHKIAVQHHFAHLLSVLADNGTCEPAIGLIFDGTGYGLDGKIWGGEFLYHHGAGQISRMGHLEYLPLPGGEAAIKQPWRIALAYTQSLLGETRIWKSLKIDPDKIDLIEKQLRGNLNLSWTSSLGRLYDAVSAALGICSEITFEAQAAMALESVAAPGVKQSYGFRIEDDGSGQVVKLQNLWQGLMADIQNRVPPDVAAAKFQNTVVDFALAMCDNINSLTQCRTVALSGGVFQNRTLLAELGDRLADQGYRVLVHRQVPANDGGLALGQVFYYAIRK